MQNYNIKDYSVEFDRTATVDWYEKYEGWSCDCGDCQSFLAWVRQKQLPSAVTELLQIFGALPEKPTYVCELYPIGFDWGSVYCGHEDYPCGAPDFPEPNFDIMFFVDIPPFDSKGE